MQILTGEQMREVDRRAIEELGICGLLLMEAAGSGVTESLLRDYPDLAGRRPVVLCGKGNNGGDGLVVARHLARRGIRAAVALLGPDGESTGDAAVNLRAARASGVAVDEIASPDAWTAWRGHCAPGVLVLDAILGTGARGGARGLAGHVIRDLGRSGATVVSVDVPSGLDADSHRVPGPAVRAERTYTLCRPKLALVLDPAAEHAGAWSVVGIGIPPSAVDAQRAELEWFDARAAAALLSRRAADSHKGTYGHLLAVAGSRGKSGAAVLLARGALRSGVGLVTVATPASVQERVAVQPVEAMTEPLEETAAGALAEPAAASVARLLEARSALAVGPGLGRDAESLAAVRAVLSACGRPAVVDADALGAFSVAAPPPRARTAPLVLTPHPGEAARMLGCTAAEVQDDRLAAARSLARDLAAVVALKGHRTIVAAPDGRAAINSSGNPGMASGGTGDVLTGIVGAFLARGLDAWDSARLAVFLHGRAGDLAAAAVGRESLIASDLIDHLPPAIESLRSTEEPQPW